MANEKTMYDDIFSRMYNSVDRMVRAYNSGDANRNRVNYGSATAYASIICSMGHDVDLRAYEKDGYLLTDSIVVDGKGFDFFHN